MEKKAGCGGTSQQQQENVKIDGSPGQPRQKVRSYL
jgi:hypothetical protein